MNWLAGFVVRRAALAWVLALLAALVVAIVAGFLAQVAGERERLSILQTDAERRSVELMSQTLNGIMMGAMSIIGLSDGEVKLEAVKQIQPNSPAIAELLETIGRTYMAEGMFIVPEDGIVASSWDSGGRTSTGLNVKFRPYFMMAMQGIESVYAAISLTTGKRALYFAAPIHALRSKGSVVTGAVVIRSGLARVDNLLKGDAEIALLLSPQGVVFASNQEEWVGQLAGVPTPERVKAIRDLKQFGSLFDKQEIKSLPFSVEPGVMDYLGRRHAVQRAKLNWNDPFGDWSVVLIEDLSRTLPVLDRLLIGAASGVGFVLIGALFLLMLRGHYAQANSAAELQAHAERQELLAERKSCLAAASMRLQQATSLESLGATFFEEVHRLLNVLQGALYVRDAGTKKELSLAAGFACADDIPRLLVPGDGLLGQCALEGRPLFIDAPPASYWRISSGLGTTRPSSVAILPVLRNQDVLGVIELAVLRPLDTDSRELLEELLTLVALNLEVLRRNRHAEKVAAESANALRDLERMDEVERFNRLAQGREQRILELKREVNQLAAAAGEPERYSTTMIETIGDHVLDPHPHYSTTLPSTEPKQLRLDELVDLGELQTLFSSFCESVGIAAAIIDLDAKVLASSRWQRACTDFHRVDPRSCARCIESDTELALKLQDGSDYTMYTCKNGMTDCASPIIVEGQHLANVFIGQFHLGTPNLAFFTEQAKQFDYPEAEYLQAVAEAPVMDQKRLPVLLGFLTGFARMVTTMSLAKHRADEAQRMLQQQADTLKRERVAAMSLAEDAEQARLALIHNAEAQP